MPISSKTVVIQSRIIIVKESKQYNFYAEKLIFPKSSKDTQTLFILNLSNAEFHFSAAE